MEGESANVLRRGCQSNVVEWVWHRSIEAQRLKLEALATGVGTLELVRYAKTVPEFHELDLKDLEKLWTMMILYPAHTDR
jgi:hypothetical protein